MEEKPTQNEQHPYIIHQTFKVGEALSTFVEDAISVELPLDIIIKYGQPEDRHTSNLAVTMRTPGKDAVLVAGFLYTEGIIQQPNEILSIRNQAPSAEDELQLNRIIVELHPDCNFSPASLERNFFAASSCGICGKTSMDLIHDEFHHPLLRSKPMVTRLVLSGLKKQLDELDAAFVKTGSMHTSVLFESEGTLLGFAEDVGRHNALDKLIGHYFQKGHIPLSEQILLLSGRISFELVQKALRAGIPIIAAVGAPSTAAIDLAQSHGQTLIGFLKDNSFNVYCGKERIAL